MKKQSAVFLSLFCSVLLLFSPVAFGAREVPSSSNGSVQSNGQSLELKQEEVENANQNSGEAQNKEMETEGTREQSATGGGDAQANVQNQANVSRIESKSEDSNVSLNQNQNKFQAKQGEEMGKSPEEKNQRSLERRSQVAKAIMEMERIGDSNQGIGEQVRIIAQSQNEGQDRVETSLQTVQNRNRVVRFLLGPDYKKIKDIEAELGIQQTRIQEMIKLANQLDNEGEAQAMMEQIALLQDIEDQVRQELENEQTGLSLFGWLFKWLVK